MKNGSAPFQHLETVFAMNDSLVGSQLSLKWNEPLCDPGSKSKKEKKKKQSGLSRDKE